MMTPGSAWHLLVTLPCLSGIPSRERVGETASNSEKRRWLVNRSVVINGRKPQPDELVAHPITELVLFPKGNRVTLV
jgi:hypothetical protein